MNKSLRYIQLFFLSTLIVSCLAQNRMQNVDEALAFPGAEGFGRHVTGGRGGKVFVVSNLNDSGKGSFREAATAKEPRMIVFAVSGTIHLLTDLTIRENATIAGQTAPGGGICIADRPVKLENNIIIRFMRFRMGDRFQNKGKVHGSGHDDALSAYKRSNIIIDHCSFSWSTDECISVYGGDNITLQWNIISEPLNYSYHFEEGDKDFENHGYGGIWGGTNMSAHHNLFAHCASRTPRFDGTRNIRSEFVDYRNNVIYNWGSNNVYGGEGGVYNIINNYYKPGPSTNKGSRQRIVGPNKEERKGIGFGKYFVAGNHMRGSAEVTSDNSLGVHMGNGGGEADKEAALLKTETKAEPVTTHSAEQAFNLVLRFAGAILPSRDTLDARIVNDVKNGTGRIIDVQGGYPHGTAYELTTDAWPVLRMTNPPQDTDSDGMPDEWEKINSLDPNDPSDSNGHSLHTHYTNIEVYVNSLVNLNET